MTTILMLALSVGQLTPVESAWDRALRLHVPLILHIRDWNPAVQKALPGSLHFRVDDLNGRTTGLAVGVPESGRMWLRQHWTPGTVADVRGWLDRRPAASPFPGADDSTLTAGLWSDAVEMPEGLTRYKSGRWTQEIAVTNGRDRITAVPKGGLAAVWQVPGGMVGITGWRSDLYRYVPTEPQTWIGNISVWNGSNFQSNRGLLRRYPEGSQFHDVLSYRGKVFEHRLREVQDGHWLSRIVFRDKSARPPGYTGLGPERSCISCHSQSGSGGYATGLVPGGGGVLSEELDWTALGKGR